MFCYSLDAAILSYSRFGIKLGVSHHKSFIMPQFTIITNTSTSVLYIGIGTKADTSLFAELINGNPNEEIVKSLQTASKEFKKRLHLLDIIGERTYPLKQFFNHIPTGQHYWFLPGRIEDRIQIYLLAKQLSLLDKVPLKSPNLERISSYFYEHYEVRIFTGDNRLNIGEFNKSKRVCRFWGRSMPKVTFMQKAHAISESLGNKGLICREECDDCNQRFNQTIEQDITRLFQFFIILSGTKGKNGSPTLQGNGISITNDSSSRHTLGRDTLVFKVKTMPDTSDPQEIAKFISDQFSFSNVNYVPQNIYKCFCKYVLSVIDHKYLPYFKETINWINEPITHHRLPPAWYYCVSSSPAVPSLVIMLRKHKHKEIPYCWAIINIAGYQYMFIIPFCSKDKYKFVGKGRVQFFLDGLKNAMPNISMQPMKLHSIRPTRLRITANFTISPECVEGRDYFFFNPQNQSKE